MAAVWFCAIALATVATTRAGVRNLRDPAPLARRRSAQLGGTAQEWMSHARAFGAFQFAASLWGWLILGSMLRAWV